MRAGSAWDFASAQALIATERERARAFYGTDGCGATALLPTLHALNDAFGFVPPAAVPLVATALNLSQADVRGVVSFYHDFAEAPTGRHLLHVCRAEACQAMGSERVMSHLALRHDLHPGTTTNGVTLRDVYCLGNCALGPAALVNGELCAGFDASTADALLARLTDASS